MPPKVLYGVSPIGLGHATRSMVVIEGLMKRSADVRVVTGGNPVEFMRSQGFEVDDVVDDPVPEVEGGEMRSVLRWYLRSWLAFRRGIPRVREISRDFQPDVEVGDEEFMVPSVGLEEKKPTALMTDELELGFAKSLLAKYVEGKVAAWYAKLQERVSLCIIPEDGKDYRNVKHVGPITRPATKDNETIFRDYGLPANRKMVLLSMSGSGIGSFLVEKTIQAVDQLNDEGYYLAVTGNRGEKIAYEGVYDLGVVPDGQNLVSVASLVVSTAGKSTIDEARRYGVPVVVIPIKGHAEQERNAAALGYSAEDLERMPDIVRSRAGLRLQPLTEDGAETCVDLILSLAGDSRRPRASGP